MTFETTPWKTVVSGLRAAIFQAETEDMLMRKVVDIVDAAYGANSILWVYATDAEKESWRVYGTAMSWQWFKAHSAGNGVQSSETAASGGEARLAERPQWTEKSKEKSNIVRRFRPTVIPDWLMLLMNHPEPMQLNSGDWIIPVIDPLSDSKSFKQLDNGASIDEAPSSDAGDRQPSAAPSVSSIRFVVQIYLSDSSSPMLDASYSGCEAGREDSAENIVGMSRDVWGELQSIGDHLLLACDALKLKRQLEQSQRHVSLLSRTSHILNTSVHPDRAIQQILAEMGQCLRCDRIVVFDLRHQHATMMTNWERPRQQLKSFEDEGLEYSFWQNTIDVFLQGGASYLDFQLTDDAGNVLDDDPLCAWFRAVGVNSALVLPMFIREEFFGAIALLSQRTGRRYPTEELQMAQQSTDQLSIAFTLIQHAGSSPASATEPAQPFTASQLHLLTDGLTRLPNREALDRELDTLSKTSVWAFRAPFSLILCDLDYFKLVNDNHGHDVGDRILRRVAQSLQHQLRRTTPLYRYGGEEFVVVLEQTELDVAADVAERLRQTVRSMPFRIDSELLTITASFGVAQLIPDKDQHAIEVLQRAEEALFEAKREGRDRVSVKYQWQSPST
jgi:diguanylate cyclase (GGDEF)-like protein